jgi:hypothetical protein
VAVTLLGEKRCVPSPVPEQRPENSARNGVAPLLEGKALGTELQQSRGQKKGFLCQSGSTIISREKRWVQFCTGPKPENSAKNGIARLLEKKALCTVLQKSRGQKTGLLYQCGSTYWREKSWALYTYIVRSTRMCSSVPLLEPGSPRFFGGMQNNE